MDQNESKKKSRGYSIVELAVVIVIAVVMVGVLAPKYFRYKEKTREAVDLQSAQQAASALLTYCAGREDLPAVITITITKSGAASSETLGQEALANAGLGDMKLRGKWGDAGITITYTIEGGVVTYTGEAKNYWAENAAWFTEGKKTDAPAE